MMEVPKCPNCDEPLSKVTESGSDVFLEWDETRRRYVEKILWQDNYRAFCSHCCRELDWDLIETPPIIALKEA